MTDPRECPCSRPADPWLCRTCLRDLHTTVHTVAPRLAILLRPVVEKTAKAGASVRTAATGSRPPLNIAAFDALEGIRNITRWRDHDLTMLARHEHVLTVKVEADAAVKAARLVLDPPPARVTVGPCTMPDCPGSARAGEGEQEARCDVCGQGYAVRDHLRARVLSALGMDATPGRAADAARRLTEAGLAVKAKDVENWVRAGRLAPIGEQAEGRRAYRLYRMADVYDAATRRTA